MTFWKGDKNTNTNPDEEKVCIQGHALTQWWANLSKNVKGISNFEPTYKCCLKPRICDY